MEFLSALFFECFQSEKFHGDHLKMREIEVETNLGMLLVCEVLHLIRGTILGYKSNATISKLTCACGHEYVVKKLDYFLFWVGLEEFENGSWKE